MVSFNTAEHWADSVSADIAREIRRLFDAAYDDLPSTVEAFLECHAGQKKQLQFEAGLISWDAPFDEPIELPSGSIENPARRGHLH